LTVTAAFLPAVLLDDSRTPALAFSSEVDTGSRDENASKQEAGASVLIQSEPDNARVCVWVSNAIHNALGKRFHSLPMSLPKVLAVIEGG
jgi:hypothetical protein